MSCVPWDGPRGLPGWPCAPDPGAVSRDAVLAHKPWPGNITFNRGADKPGGRLGTSATLCFGSKSFPPSETHFLFYQMGEI